MGSIWQQPAVIAHCTELARSFRHVTKRDLLPGLFNPLGLSRNLFHAPLVLVSHGTEDDPVLNYGNATVLALWEMTWQELTSTPSRLTAEAPNRGERERLLARVTADGFIDDYSGCGSRRAGGAFASRRPPCGI